MDVKNLKKVELHCHLDGSVRPSTAAEILGISLEEAESKMCYKGTASNLNEYLTKFDTPCSIMQTKENIERVSRELAEDMKAENIIYAEVRFSPHKLTEKGLTLDEVVTSALKGFKSVDGIIIRVILCMMRGFEESVNHEVLDLYDRFKDKGVCAIDLAGAEAMYPTSLYESLFNEALERNIPFTIHSGEADGVESIRCALRFGTTRLGHGVRIFEDTNLLEVAWGRDVLFEVCPTSNLQTGVSESYKEHQLRRLVDEGCSVLINTDNRTVSDTNLTKEIELMVENQGYTINDLKRMMKDGIKHAFIDQESKEYLLQIIDN